MHIAAGHHPHTILALVLAAAAESFSADVGHDMFAGYDSISASNFTIISFTREQRWGEKVGTPSYINPWSHHITRVLKEIMGKPPGL